MNTVSKLQKASALYSPKNCYEAGKKIRTVQDVFKYPAKTLGQLKSEFGQEWVLGYIKAWLMDLNDSIQVDRGLNEFGMDFLAEQIYLTYPLKITDLTLFFRNIKSGVYGHFYENLSPDKVMNWLAEYWTERCEAGAMQAQSNHENYSMTKDKVHPEIIKAMFDGVGEHEFEQPEGRGIGTRLEAEIGLKEGEKAPIQDRDVYLSILEETAKKASKEELLKSIEHLREKNNEPDALEILENELKKR